ncbi:MAG: hypothetical protein ACPG6B_05215, partial [Oceanihabitans sp.]
MKSTIQLLLVAFIFTLTACKNQGTSFSDYKYADKPEIIKCNVESKILNEALYAFENDIQNQYDKNLNSINHAYNSFARQINSRRPIPFKEFISKHTITVAKALQETDIFINGKVNYQSEAISCLAENMVDSDIKTTFNALLTTNSMSRDLFGPALQAYSSKVASDKHLGLYMALEYFYAEAVKIDYTDVDFENRTAPKKNLKMQPKIAPVKPTN